MPGLSLLYSQDFSVLPNQTLVPGANIIGGQRWWFKGAFTQSNEALAIVNGVGLRSDQRSVTSYDYAIGSLPACMVLDFADLVGYNADLPVLVQYRFEEVDLTYPSNIYPVGSLVTASGDDSAVKSAERTGINGVIYDKNAGSWRYQATYVGGASSPVTIAGPQSGAANLNVFELCSVPILRHQVFGLAHATLATDWPDPASTTPDRAYFPGLPLGSTASPNQGFAFWAANNIGPDFGLRRHSLRAIRVYQVSSAAPSPPPPPPPPTLPLDYGTGTLLTFRSALKRLAPPWLQKGRAEKYLYAIGLQFDALVDGYVAGFKSAFPGVYTNETLPLIGQDSRIRRGRVESSATYAVRLLRWLDDHSTRGGPYAMLAQLHAFFAPDNFQIRLVYRSGRQYTMAIDGTITRAGISFSPDAQPEKWARWWLYYTWPTAQGKLKYGTGLKYGGGHVYGSDLTPQEVVDLRVIPRDWNAAHAFGRIVLETPSGNVQLSLGDWNAG